MSLFIISCRNKVRTVQTRAQGSQTQFCSPVQIRSDSFTLLYEIRFLYLALSDQIPLPCFIRSDSFTLFTPQLYQIRFLYLVPPSFIRSDSFTLLYQISIDSFTLAPCEPELSCVYICIFIMGEVRKKHSQGGGEVKCHCGILYTVQYSSYYLRE